MKKTILLFVVILTMLFSTVFACAASDPAVTIVNPANQAVLYSDSLLISVKVTQPKSIRISVMEKKQTVNGEDVSIDVNKLATDTTNSAIDAVKNAKDVEVCDPEKFTCTNNLSFFTKQVNALEPGMYVVKVETLDSSGKVTASSSSMVALMGKKAADAQDKLIDTPQGGALQFFKDLFKNLFS